MYNKPFSTELLRNEKKRRSMTCNFSFLRGCFARSRFLKPNDKKSYEKHLITIDHKHNLYINFRLVRITYFHNATVINKSAFLVQPLIFNLFSLRFQTHLSSRVYTTSRIILLCRLAQTIMLFDKYVWYDIWLTLFLPTEVFWPWPREPNYPSKFSRMDDFCFARVVTPRATWHLRPSHGVSTLIWLSVNCYCFVPHHKSLSLLSLLSVSTLFFPKINSRCICRMALYTQAWVAGARKILETK